MTAPPAVFARAVLPVRATVARTVRRQVAGPDADTAAERIWRSPGPRWFAPGDPIWRVHSDPLMMVGGLRALLLQSLHPLAMAGVAGHSGYRGDPWGRLHRTSTFIATTTYAPIPDAEALLARIRGIHERVRGRSPDGRRYAASDPHLLAWVHAAEADSFLAAHQAYATRPLTPVEADTYVAQAGTVAARLGVEHPPRTYAALQATLTAYDPELTAGPAALDAAAFLLNDPPLPPAARVGYQPVALGAVAILPDRARTLLGLTDGRWSHDVAARGLARQTFRFLRWCMDHPADQPLPDGWRHQPAA